MRKLALFFPLLLSLAVGLIFSFSLWPGPPSLLVQAQPLLYDSQDFSQAVQGLEDQVRRLGEDSQVFSQLAQEQAQAYQDQEDRLDDIAKSAEANRQDSQDIYEDHIVALLGQPVGSSTSDHARVKVFDFKKIDYRGYVAKVTPRRSGALDLARAEEGKLESTLSAYERTGAQLAVNGGGFFSNKVEGKNFFFALGNTVMDGKLINSFIPSSKDITFIGFRKDGSLVGGQYETKEALMADKPYAGSSFVPPLIKDKAKLDIPSKWANARQPRTIVGEYPNKDILLIVIDGRQADWSKGVTLEEAQDVLLQLGIHRAYNLDGGGSSSMVFKGKTLNRPSDGQARSVVTNIIVH